ncbi:probable serine/threonine-protein kinase PBL18 [Impatiens glandulifera]|uniref:probable serine/threonine-protein kinase PBL18 n=1 Tax=Impatiens glandulifera TaxID=253017 RepID=UPI001FB15784|nr:probable serine/threonine-protein kinase PBL18 [Impatiens glandulifera]
MGNCWIYSSRVDNGPFTPDDIRSGPLIENPRKFTPPTSLPPLTHLMTKDKKNEEPIALPSPRSESEILSWTNLKSLTLHELKIATKNFKCEIGEGGFGCVYKGYLGCGTVVAVKQLNSEGYQGHKEWLAEVKYLGQLHHLNLVKLIGYCLEGENRLLVYEFMPGGSLENRLFTNGIEHLSWAIRVKIAIGAARGLHFLHSCVPPVIYRDFKSSNILLDSEFNAKLSDFGLAKSGPRGEETHVTTQVFGTQGYTAPEYICTGRLTAKCDVYSFGVVLIELLSGRRAIDNTKSGHEKKLVEWAWPNLDQKLGVVRIMDTKLGGQYPRRAASIAAMLAKQCTHLDAKARPQMVQVLSILEELPSARYMYPSSMDQQVVSQNPSSSCQSPRNDRNRRHQSDLLVDDQRSVNKNNRRHLSDNLVAQMSSTDRQRSVNKNRTQPDQLDPRNNDQRAGNKNRTPQSYPLPMPKIPLQGS